jgi:small subunit ribosomal protein S23
MVRRIASQVHQQAARLLRSNFIQKEPAWYQAVLEHPPLPLPPRKAASRTKFDLPPPDRAKLKHHEPRPLPISYIEDDVRRQFFRDHPFEAWRPVSLVELGAVEDEHPIQGKAWIRLRQRGRNPSPEEYAFHYIQ